MSSAMSREPPAGLGLLRPVRTICLGMDTLAAGLPADEVSAHDAAVASRADSTSRRTQLDTMTLVGAARACLPASASNREVSIKMSRDHDRAGDSSAAGLTPLIPLNSP